MEMNEWIVVTSHFSVFCDRDSAESELLLAGQHVVDGVLRAEDERVEDKSVLVLLHAHHLLGLVVGGAVVVDDPDAFELERIKRLI